MRCGGAWHENLVEAEGIEMESDPIYCLAHNVALGAVRGISHSG